ncbi:O-methyltransferase [Metabacillus bambusae]|uniref:Uncharacterized protein n=1 Tax=Metabacillus bambusae TaxID=2795218 RepID=A0ABS3NAE3_9BACI|nr:hypothetical protein [Metabacillus bambusae]
MLGIIGFRHFFIIPINHDKENYPNYLDRSIRLANPGALIVGDNVLQAGRVYDTSYVDLRTENMRAFINAWRMIQIWNRSFCQLDKDYLSAV